MPGHFGARRPPFYRGYSAEDPMIMLCVPPIAPNRTCKPTTISLRITLDQGASRLHQDLHRMCELWRWSQRLRWALLLHHRNHGLGRVGPPFFRTTASLPETRALVTRASLVPKRLERDSTRIDSYIDAFGSAYYLSKMLPVLQDHDVPIRFASIIVRTASLYGKAFETRHRLVLPLQGVLGRFAERLVGH